MGNITQNNQAARGTQLSVMLCPDDVHNRQPFNGSSSGDTNQMGDGWARGNYAANATLVQMNDSFCCPYGAVMSCGARATSPGWTSPCTRGVMGANVAVQMAEITDGASNTILLGETLAGIYPFDFARRVGHGAALQRPVGA